MPGGHIKPPALPGDQTSNMPAGHIEPGTTLTDLATLSVGVVLKYSLARNIPVRNYVTIIRLSDM